MLTLECDCCSDNQQQSDASLNNQVHFSSTDVELEPKVVLPSKDASRDTYEPPPSDARDLPGLPTHSLERLELLRDCDFDSAHSSAKKNESPPASARSKSGRSRASRNRLCSKNKLSSDNLIEANRSPRPNFMQQLGDCSVANQINGNASSSSEDLQPYRHVTLSDSNSVAANKRLDHEQVASLVLNFLRVVVTPAQNFFLTCLVKPELRAF